MEQYNKSQRQITGKHWRKYILIQKLIQTNKPTNNEVIMMLIIIIAVIAY
jgi:hypothetical protein